MRRNQIKLQNCTLNNQNQLKQLKKGSSVSQPVLNNPIKLIKDISHANLMNPLHLEKKQANGKVQELDFGKLDKLRQLHYICTKAQHVYHLRFQTLFLAYSIGQKTLEIIEKLPDQKYWMMACLYMAMKYEEIYPERLKNLALSLFKINYITEMYLDTELKILDKLDNNLNFFGLNHMLSKFLYSMTENQSYYVFYLLDLALAIRQELGKFTLKEIVLSIMVILSSYSLHLGPNELVYGVKYSRLQTCAKGIIKEKHSNQSRAFFIYNKYKLEKNKFVSMNSLPSIEALTKIIKKAASTPNQQWSITGLEKARSTAIETREKYETSQTESNFSSSSETLSNDDL